MEFTKNHLQKGSELWKTVLFADEANIMYLDQMENTREVLQKKVFIQRSNMVMVA
jgi:hypothetical protein